MQWYDHHLEYVESFANLTDLGFTSPEEDLHTERILMPFYGDDLTHPVNPFGDLSVADPFDDLDVLAT